MNGIIMIGMLLSSLQTVSNSALNDKQMTIDEMEKALIYAAQAGLDEKVAIYIKQVKDINASDNNGRTALMCATYGNHISCARMLIKAGADVNAQDDIKNSPFLYAAASGHLEIAKLCVMGGADFHLLNRFGGTGLIPAAEKGHPEMVKYLLSLKGFPKDHINYLGWTAVLEVVVLTDGSEKYQQILHYLIEGGCDINIPDKDGLRPLQLARKYNKVALVKILEAAGAKG
jgi:ankyrin repeat protein